MRIQLNLDQRQRLVKALQVSYDQATLEAMVFEHLGRKLASAVPLPQTWNVIPTRLLQTAEMEAWNGDLILAAAAYAPHEPELTKLALELRLSPAAAGRLTVSSSVLAKGIEHASLEGLVKKTSPLQDVQAFIAALTQLQYQVCRIETGSTVPTALGTGFLVGKDLVLTNWHVADLIGLGPAQVRCRFDYHADAAGLAVNAGFTVALAPQWELHAREYAESDVRRDGVPPTPIQLDYALIRLTSAVAEFAPGKNAPVPGGPQRGFIRLDASAPLPSVHDELFVLQHPSGEPMKLAVGQVMERVVDPAHPLRIRHDSTTEGGSSGSPCFNSALQLVALHHATDPENPQRPKFNQGIPIHLIHSDLQAAGFLI